MKNPPPALAMLSIAAASVLTHGSDARADEGGVPFWFSGQYASLAAVPAVEGFSLPTFAYYYEGSAAFGERFERADRIVTRVDSSVALLLVQPTYAPEAKVLGGRLSAAVGFGVARSSTSAHVSGSPGGAIDRSDSKWGGSDVYPLFNLAWASGAQNGMVYLNGDIPVGAYDMMRLSNIGIGHAAIDAGGGYTYFDQKNGREASAVLGATYNFENPSTRYKNGIDSHLDWAASQFVSKNFDVGVAGYVYYQLTGDTGSGARLGPFRSKVASVGPELGYAFTIGGLGAYANARGYWEFWAENRLRGYALFGTITIPLGPRPSRRP